MKGDITVFGLTMGHHLVEDIGVVVPHMEVVVIPAKDAYASKDLWRAINMRKVFHLHAGTKSWPAGVSVPMPVPTDQTRLLEQALEEQRAQNAAVLRAMSEQGALVKQLSETVANLRAVAPAAAAPTTQSQEDLPSGDAPMFVPSTVKPSVTEQRIRGKESTTDAGGVVEARAQLRNLRAKR
jgi:hypothetical protein